MTPGSSNDCHSQRHKNNSQVDVNHSVYGGVIAWADRPFGGSVVAWSQPRCNNINIVTHATQISWPVIPGYWSPTDPQTLSGNTMTSQTPNTMTLKQRRMPSRTRSNAPHSGNVHWVNQSPQTEQTTSLADARPRVWCIKHASRTCGCYSPSPKTTDQVQMASTQSVQP